jgi:hypothetical protein
MSTIEKLERKYYEITSDNNNDVYSFWAWLDSISAGTSEKILNHILNNIEEYI